LKMKFLAKSKKSPQIIKVLKQAIEIIIAVGIPIENKKDRAIEKMAMSFLAVAGVTQNWSEAKGLEESRFLTSREIIGFVNKHFEENISSGSYDDIRRKDLDLFVLGDFILKSGRNPSAATNDPTRGFTLSPDFAKLIKMFGMREWQVQLENFLRNKVNLKETLARKRAIEKVAVLLPNGKKLEFSAGQHNLLQKQIIEEFLPRFGKGCQILYVGDTANKFLHFEKEELTKLKFFQLAHEELPDIIAFNKEKNWLYLIEAVHSSGAINEIRMFKLKRLTEQCNAEIIYVTAFLSKSEFRKWVTEIAWETEVWIAENPDHLIHFNGDKFLGPYEEMLDTVADQENAK
jgi:BsuBI/PstI restriction endonuclease domain/BsuBI/PstI restriction endonuclease HTH domain